MAVFECPNCSHTQDVPDAYIGRTAKCLKCEARGEVTAANPKTPPANPSAAQPKVSESPRGKPDLPPNTSAKRTEFRHIEGRIVTGLLAAILATQLFSLTRTNFTTTQWEYIVESPIDANLDSALERLGDQEWELVFARRATSSYGSASYEMIFKRPKR
jgi:hypothetical protein